MSENEHLNSSYLESVRDAVAMLKTNRCGFLKLTGLAGAKGAYGRR